MSRWTHYIYFYRATIQWTLGRSCIRRIVLLVGNKVIKINAGVVAIKSTGAEVGGEWRFGRVYNNRRDA